MAQAGRAAPWSAPPAFRQRDLAVFGEPGRRRGAAGLARTPESVMKAEFVAGAAGHRRAAGEGPGCKDLPQAGEVFRPGDNRSDRCAMNVHAGTGTGAMKSCLQKSCMP